MAFCGSGKKPKNKKYGTEEECRKAGQVRLWGNRKVGKKENSKSDKVSQKDFYDAFKNPLGESSAKDSKRKKFLEKVNKIIRKSEVEIAETQKDLDETRKIIKEGEKRIQQYKEEKRKKKKNKELDKVIKKSDNVIVSLKKTKEKKDKIIKDAKKEIKNIKDSSEIVLTERTKNRIIKNLSVLQKKFRDAKKPKVSSENKETAWDRIKKSISKGTQMAREKEEKEELLKPRKGIFSSLLKPEAREEHLKKMEYLNSKRKQVDDATVKFQYILRKRKKNMSDKNKPDVDKNKAVISIQSLARKIGAKKNTDNKKKAINKIQSLVRDRLKYKKTILPHIPYNGGEPISLVKKNKRRKDYEDIKVKLASSYVPMTKKNRAVKMATEKLVKRHKKNKEIKSNLKKLKEYVSRKK